MEFKNLLALIEAVSESELTGLKYEEKGVKVQLTKTQGEIQVMQAQAPATYSQAQTTPAPASIISETSAEEAVIEGEIIHSPLVGTFYTASSEDAAPFVAVGDRVKIGQTLAIVEAMKLMNEIESEFDGTIVEILVENGQAVEYGHPLFRIK